MCDELESRDETKLSALQTVASREIDGDCHVAGCKVAAVDNMGSGGLRGSLASVTSLGLLGLTRGSLASVTGALSSNAESLCTVAGAVRCGEQPAETDCRMCEPAANDGAVL